MTTAEKLVKIAKNEQKVYEAGQKSEQDRFWDALQNDGKSMDTSYMFCGYYWNDAIYNPKHTIVSSSCSQMYRFSMISDVKVVLDFSACTGTYLFTNMPNLKRIPKIIVNPNITYTGWFSSSPNIEEIRFDGTIGKSLDIHWATKLSYDSVENIFGHLGDTASATLTLPKSHDDGRYDSLIADKMPPNWAVSWL